MSDLDGASSVIAHGAGAVGSGGLGAWVMHFFKSRQEAEERKERAKLDQEIAVALATLVGEVKEIRAVQREQAEYGERLAIVERDLVALHERIDDDRAPRPKRRPK